jgi:hypothetical protein
VDAGERLRAPTLHTTPKENAYVNLLVTFWMQTSNLEVHKSIVPQDLFFFCGTIESDINKRKKKGCAPNKQARAKSNSAKSQVWKGFFFPIKEVNSGKPLSLFSLDTLRNQGFSEKMLGARKQVQITQIVPPLYS